MKCCWWVGLLFTPGCDRHAEDLAYADLMWQEIQGDDLGYRSFPQLPGLEDILINEDNGSPRRVFVNGLVIEAAELAWSGELPDGALLIKEQWAAGEDTTGTPRNITFMTRRAGYAPDHHDWFWVNFLPSGEVMEEEGQPVVGDLDNCIRCHGVEKENDYVLTYSFSGEGERVVE